MESEDFIVKQKSGREVKSFLKDEFYELLQAGNNFYSDFSNSMKDEEFEKKVLEGSL